MLGTLKNLARYGIPFKGTYARLRFLPPVPGDEVKEKTHQADNTYGASLSVNFLNKAKIPYPPNDFIPSPEMQYLAGICLGVPSVEYDCIDICSSNWVNKKQGQTAFNTNRLIDTAYYILRKCEVLMVKKMMMVKRSD